MAHRGEILGALYTILLGNPRRGQKSPTAAPTRFKEWWDLVGSAIEYAAAQLVDLVKSEVEWCVADPPPQASRPVQISFKSMFLEGENEDEETTGLAAFLTMLRARWWGREFKASAVASDIEPEGFTPTDEARELRAALERAAGKVLRPVSAATVTWCLKKLADALPRSEPRRSPSNATTTARLATLSGS